MRLSDGEIRAFAAHHFGDLGAEAVEIARAICLAESGGEVGAINDNYPRWQPDANSIYRYDYGLMQINSVHQFDAQRLVSDGDYNFGCARVIYNMQGWNAWTTYKWGAYLAFYQEPVALPPEPPPPPPPAPVVLSAEARTVFSYVAGWANYAINDGPWEQCLAEMRAWTDEAERLARL